MKVFLSSTYIDLIEHRKAAHILYPHDDELSCYIYKVRLHPCVALKRTNRLQLAS